MKDLLHLCTCACAIMYFFACVFVCSERVTGKQEELQRENEREKTSVCCVWEEEKMKLGEASMCVCVRVLCIIAGMRREGA